MLTALVRRPGPELSGALRTHIDVHPIDATAAAAQHAAYVQTLQSLGAHIRELPPTPAHPDGPFVEDVLVLTPECAVITRPGDPSRRGETAAVGDALDILVPRWSALPAPARLDGGDVLRLGRRLLVGLSSRTDLAGAQALAGLLHPFGYRVEPVVVAGHLHLKTGLTALPDGSLLLAPGVEVPAVSDLPRIHRAPEAAGGNVLVVNGTVLVSASAPRTTALVASLGFPTAVLDIGEFERAEAGLTCLCVLLDTTAGRND